MSWQSKKQTGVTLSSTESEFVAMSMAATEIKFVVSLLTEIFKGPPLLPSILKEDNDGGDFHGSEHGNWTADKACGHSLSVC